MVEFQIVVDNIVVGRFMHSYWRDRAFETYILPQSGNCYKKDVIGVKKMI